MSKNDASPSIEPARPYIGGQALLEGVMMRSPHSFAIVCRRRSGELFVRERPLADERQGARAIPFLRGMVTLVESLKLGSEALRYAGELYEQDLALDDEPSAPTQQTSDGEPGAAKTGKTGSLVASATGKTNLLSSLTALPLLGQLTAVAGQLGSRAGQILAALSLPVVALASLPADHEPGSGPEITPTEPQERGKLGQILMIAFSLGLFVAAPQAGANLINNLLGLGLDIRSAGFQLLTGAMKLSIVVGYLSLIRQVPDIRRVFQYHGAEHKTISTYEAQEPLVVENARAKTTLHPRCGTTFLVMVALVSVVVFAAIGPFLPRFGENPNSLLANVGLFLLKLPFIPVIAGVTFELQRLFARYCTTGPLRALLWPGFVVQKITTIEPDDTQLEVALGSLRATLWREASPEAAPAEITELRFPSYEALSTHEGYAAR
jgi:uncharacterized protein YqhQ